MKKLFLLALFLVLLAGLPAEGQNPIPSWNTQVRGKANFVERLPQLPVDGTPLRGKRVLHLSGQGTASVPVVVATVWVYCKETGIVIGPLELTSGEPLAVDIDENEWGVWIECDTQIIVNVWIDDGVKMNLE